MILKKCKILLGSGMLAAMLLVSTGGPVWAAKQNNSLESIKSISKQKKNKKYKNNVNTNKLNKKKYTKKNLGDKDVGSFTKKNNEKLKKFK